MENLKIRTRARGYAPYTPKADAQDIIDRVVQILLEYEKYLPLTIRQVFYRLVARYLFPKTENAYGRLCEIMNRARRAGMIDFAHIRDDGTSLYEWDTWASPAEWMAQKREEAKGYRLDRQTGQPVRLFVICEAMGVAPMLAGIANRYGVSVRSSGGFDSTTTKEAFARELAQYPATEILHLGDFDPSGEHIFSVLRDDVLAFFPSHSIGRLPRFTRLAVTPDQIAKYDLPTAPPKATDKRSFEGTETVQLESLDPKDLTQILRDAIEARRDMEILQNVLGLEAEERAELIDKMDDDEDDEAGS